MYLFFDVETVGFPKKWNAPHTETYNWPRMVQIAWQLYDKDRVLLEVNDFIIKPEGFEIPYDSERIHGISTERARQEGVALEEALKKFALVIPKADYVMAHNMNFDANVVGAEFIRKNIDHRLFESDQYCTMQESTWFCKIPGKGGRYKWPTLTELHTKLFGVKFADAHNALVDVQATANCFFKLLDLEAIELF